MRIEYIEIEGKRYPLCFSIAASEMITEKYKNIEMMEKNLNDKNFPDERKINILCDLISAMMYSGCQYYNVFKKKIYQNAPVENGKLIPLSSEQLKLCIGMDKKSMEEIMNAINRCINGGQQKKISTVYKGKKKQRR